MIAQIIHRYAHQSTELINSQLYDDQTFYRVFVRDIALSEKEVIIESPFITTARVNMLLPVIHKALLRGVSVLVNSRQPQEHDAYMRREAETGISTLLDLGVKVLFTGGHHRKLVIIDRSILWEGSLNALSQNTSCEVMRRIKSQILAKQMIDFTGVSRFIS
jgi:phosphatidylserine/phosphatidylglycerophosphate/cardiolipin synthase-like enzyme